MRAKRIHCESNRILRDGHGRSASSAADEPPRRNPKHKHKQIGRERAATRSAEGGPKESPTAERHAVCRRRWARALGVVNGHAGVEIAGCNPARRKLRSFSGKRNVTPRGAPQYRRRDVVVERDVCIAGDDTARLAPGGTTPHRVSHTLRKAFY